MGCGPSAPRPSTSDNHLHSESQQPPSPSQSAFAGIASSPASVPRVARAISATTTTTNVPRDGTHVSAPGAPRPNEPIRLPSPVRHSPVNILRHRRPWTARVLAQERTDFFDTRVTGRREVWDALRLVSEMLRDGNVPEAQGVVDAVGLTCPTGRVASSTAKGTSASAVASKRRAGGLYDERGELYEIPDWVLRDPDDTIYEPSLSGDARGEVERKTSMSENKDEVVENGMTPSPGYASPAPSEARPSPLGASSVEEKGKGRAVDEGSPMQLRARLSHAEALIVRDILVSVGSQTRVSMLAKRIMDHLEQRGDDKSTKTAVSGGQTTSDRTVNADIDANAVDRVEAPPSRRLRLVYLGKPWDDGSRTIEEHGYREGTIVQVMVLPVWDS